MDIDEQRALQWKVTEAIAGMVVAAATTKALGALWRSATGAPAPDDAADRTLGVVGPVLWAATAGAVVGVARLAGTRAAVAGWELAVGSPPPIHGTPPAE